MTMRELPETYQMLGYLLVHGPTSHAHLFCDMKYPQNTVPSLERYVKAGLVTITQDEAGKFILSLTDRIKEL